VLGADVVVVEHLGLFLGQNDDATGSVGESLKHVVTPLEAVAARPRYKESNQRFPLYMPLFAVGVTFS
jgi:hypothetical protein